MSKHQFNRIGESLYECTKCGAETEGYADAGNCIPTNTVEPDHAECDLTCDIDCNGNDTKPNEIEEIYKKVGYRIEWVRREREMTQEELGKKLVPPQTRASISNIERGRQRTPLHVLLQLSEALSVGLWRLLK